MERKKIALITGATSGMGRQFVLQIQEVYPWLDEIWVIARTDYRCYFWNGPAVCLADSGGVSVAG